MIFRKTRNPIGRIFWINMTCLIIESCQMQKFRNFIMKDRERSVIEVRENVFWNKNWLSNKKNQVLRHSNRFVLYVYFGTTTTINDSPTRTSESRACGVKTRRWRRTSRRKTKTNVRFFFFFLPSSWQAREGIFCCCFRLLVLLPCLLFTFFCLSISLSLTLTKKKLDVVIVDIVAVVRITSTKKRQH